MEFLEKMWATQKTVCIILGVLLFPIAIAIIGFKIYMSSNLDAAKKSLDKAQEKDNTLASQEDALKKQADNAVAEADKAAQRIEDRHADGAVDMDWQNKRKD
jgi:uncharacterized protein YoxC